MPQICILKQFERRFKKLCKAHQIKLKKVSEVSGFTVFEYTRSDIQDQLLFLIKMIYETEIYLLSEQRIIKSEVIQAIKLYERERGGVTALFPGRYSDLAEYIEIYCNEPRKKKRLKN